MNKIISRDIARWAVLMTSVVGLPLIAVALYLSHQNQFVHEGILNYLEIAVFLPAFMFSVFGQLPSLLAIIILEPPWLFVLFYVLKLAYDSLKSRLKGN